MITVYHSDDPELILDARVDEFLGSGKTASSFGLKYTLTQRYLPDAPEIHLLAVFTLEKTAAGIRIAVAIAESSESLLQSLKARPANEAREWAEQHELAWLELDRPLRLQAVHIPKPWGQEIWYTGIESRGQSRLVDPKGRSIPLPWLLFAFPQRLLAADSQQPILLKVLDPLPEPVLGDLYFEMHEEKREVYIVTNVDQTAWPGGCGGIRFGFDQKKRAASASDNAFKRDYLAAVNAYREVRVEIDAYLDQLRSQKGIALDAPLAPETLRQWLAQVPAELRQQESELRAAMESFIHVDPLEVGDVVKVPCYTPHSLLHGVRTVEFQTPVYERKILSFAQKVLTQAHWDTASALEQVSLEPPRKAELPVVSADENLQIEEVAQFDDFRVERLTLKAGRACTLPGGGHYWLLMTVAGELEVNGTAMSPEQAVLLSAATDSLSLSSTPDQDVIVLLAKPSGKGRPSTTGS